MKRKKHASSEEEQGKTHFSCWCLPSDFFLDLSPVFCQLKFLRWVARLLARLPVSPASRGTFCCN